MLNGLCGRVLAANGAEGEPDTRVAVSLDGVAGNKSIKLGNLTILPSQRAWFAVGIGREELQGPGTDPAQPTELFYSINDRVRVGHRVAVEDVPDAAIGACGRSVGNAMAISTFFEQAEQQNMPLAELPPVHFMLTDLNVCRIVNILGMGAELPTAAHECLLAPLQEVHRHIRRLIDAGGSIYATFEPHRCMPDGKDGQGAPVPPEDKGIERVNAVLEGSAVLYPSPHPQRTGCIEVRYVGTPTAGSETALTSRNERFIDYGPVEAITYARFAATLGDADRLSPRVLAVVDPQAFWAACMRVDAFVDALNQLERPGANHDGESGHTTKLAAEWQALADGMHLCLATCSTATADFVKWDTRGTWAGQLTSPQRHSQIAHAGAITGMFVSMDRAKAHHAAQPSLRGGRGPMCYQMLDDMQGTEIGRVFDAIVNSGGDLSKVNSNMKAAGYGEDALGLKDDPLTCCGGCGTTKGQLRKCSGCGGQVYCSATCQKAHWAQHKKSCSKVIATMRARYRDLEARGFEAPTPTSFPGNAPKSSLPQCVMSETSGVGAMSIMWNPGAKSALLHWTFEQQQQHDEGVAADAKNTVTFEKVSDLEPSLQFLLSCGPLQDLELAQSTLDGVLASVERALTESRRRSPVPGQPPLPNFGPDELITAVRAPSAGFTALEWAAKKGNLHVVEWLCTEVRTKALVRTGSPIGWACYTGRLECAKVLLRHGADPRATDLFLWGGLPPLLVACQNGQLEAIKWLCVDVGVDLRTKDRSGKGVSHHIKMPKNWEDVPGHVESLAWVKARLAATRPDSAPSDTTPIDIEGAMTASTIEAQD